ncbi:hypothetical protein Tco_0730960 [Tanacetum coccineum]
MRQSPTIVGEAHIDQLSGQRHGRVCCSVSLKVSANNIRVVALGPKKNLYSYVFEKYSQLCSRNMTPCFTAAGDSTRADASSSNHLKRTHDQTHPTLSAVQEAVFLESANINVVENTQSIHNEVIGSAFPSTAVNQWFSNFLIV